MIEERATEDKRSNFSYNSYLNLSKVFAAIVTGNVSTCLVDNILINKIMNVNVRDTCKILFYKSSVQM